MGSVPGGQASEPQKSSAPRPPSEPKHLDRQSDISKEGGDPRKRVVLHLAETHARQRPSYENRRLPPAGHVVKVPGLFEPMVA